MARVCELHPVVTSDTSVSMTISPFAQHMRIRVRRPDVVFGGLFVIGLAAIGWQEYYRKSPMLTVAGLPGPRGNSERKCDGIYSHRKYWQLPLRYVMCLELSRALGGTMKPRA